MTAFKEFVIVLLYVAISFADPTPKITFVDYVITNSENPYFGTWTAEIVPPGETLNMKTPKKQDLPANMMVNSVITSNGVVIKNETQTFCSALENEEHMQQYQQYGIPKEKWSLSCPVVACEECEIVGLKIAPKRIKPGTPASKINNVITFFMDDVNNPLLVLNSTIQVSYD